MDKFISLIVIIHVAAGIGAILFGGLAIGLKKNTPKHKPMGRVYFYCMSVIFLSGVYLSIVKHLLFLFLIAIFTYYAAVIAYRALKLKNLHNNQKPALLDWIIEFIAGTTFTGMLIYAGILYYQNQINAAIIPFFFGLIGVWGVYNNVKKYIKGQTETLYWLKKHIGNMCGSYIGAITAFVVNQSDHIPVNPAILWLGPTIIIVPIIVIETKKIKSQPL